MRAHAMRRPQGGELTVFRETYGLTLVAAAKMAGVCRRTWCYWEAGEKPMPPGLWRLVRIEALMLRRRAERLRSLAAQTAQLPRSRSR